MIESTLKLRPLHDWLVIEREPEVTELKGLVIPGSPSNRGTVIAVGSKVKDVSVGDCVQFNAYAG